MSLPQTLLNNEEYAAKHLGLLGPEVVNQHLVHARVRAEVDQVELALVHLDSFKQQIFSHFINVSQIFSNNRGKYLLESSQFLQIQCKVN